MDDTQAEPTPHDEPASPAESTARESTVPDSTVPQSIAPESTALADDDGLLGRLEVIESQPLEQRAAGFDQLAEELLTELQRSDREVGG